MYLKDKFKMRTEEEPTNVTANLMEQEKSGVRTKTDTRAKEPQAQTLYPRKTSTNKKSNGYIFYIPDNC